MAPSLWKGRDRAVESQVLEAYERLVSAFREGRWEDKSACFAAEATVVDGAEWFGSLDEYRSAWERWAAGHQDGSAVLSVETSVMKLHMLGDVAVLVHSIHMRQRTTKGRRQLTNETIVFAKQPDGRWLVARQHLSPQPNCGITTFEGFCARCYEPELTRRSARVYLRKRAGEDSNLRPAA